MTEIAEEQAVAGFDAMEKGPYDQFILFGDSITQQACSQELGFAFQPALQDGKHLSFGISISKIHVWKK